LPTDHALRLLATDFPQAVASLGLSDHRIALIGYLDHHGIAFEHDGHTVIVKNSGETMLSATFDELNRLIEWEATLKPQSLVVEGSWYEGQLRQMMGW